MYMCIHHLISQPQTSSRSSSSMESQSLLVPTLVALLSMLGMASIAVTDAASPTAEQYWHHALPNTPLPTALQRLLHPSEASTKPLTYVLYSATQWDDCDWIYEYSPCQKEVAAAKPIREESDDNTNFFLHKELHSGAKMWPRFFKSTSGPGFSPQSLPFSGQNISEIRKAFSVTPDSPEDDGIRKAMASCKAPHMDGEEKSCATTLESMVDFAVATLGNDIDKVISTDLAGGGGYKQQEYTIATAPRLMDRRDFIISHKMAYPYTLFYSHRLSAQVAYGVSLVGGDGSRVQTFSICHMNTSAWAEGHAAFRALKVKPGPAICHFPLSETLIWISKIKE